MSTDAPPPPSSLLDALPVGLGIIREGRLVYASQGLLRLWGVPARRVVGQPLRVLLAAVPQQAERLLERHQARLRGEPVPDSYELTLPTPDGERQVELCLSQQGEDLVLMMRDLTPRARHRAVLQRLAELGAALLPARAEEEVLGRVFAGLAEQGLGFACLVPQGEQLRLEHTHLPGAQLGGEGPERPRCGARTPLLERAWHEGAAYGDDLAWEAGCFVRAEHAEPVRTALRRLGPLRTVAVRVDVEGAPRALLVVAAPWLRPEELPALRLFGAQVSAALQAVRTISRLSAQNTALQALNRMATVATSAAEPGDLFEPGAREIFNLVGCDALGVYLLAEGRDELELAHAHGTEEDRRMLLPRLPLQGTLSGRSALEGVVQVVDAQSCPPLTREAMQRSGYATAAVVPLRARSCTVGTLGLAFRQHRALSALELETLRAMGSHFAAALESQRLLQEVRGRAEHLALIHEVGRSLVGTLSEEQLLEAGVTALARIVDTPAAYVLLLEEGPPGPRLVIHAAAGAHPELRGYTLALGTSRPSLSERAWQTRQPVVLEDTLSDPGLPQDLRQRAEGRALMALPLVAHGRAVGVATLVETRAPRRFTPAEVERASAIANQLALALEGARLVENLQASYAQLARTQQQLVQRERLAALGELSAVVAHEVRNPLGAIFNAVATLRRVLGQASPATPILDIVGEESERLNRIVDDLLNFARPASPSLRPVTLEGLLEDGVRRALAEATGTVDVVWALEPGVPPVLVDERMMRQAFLNLALNAVQAMLHGGVLRVGVRRAQGGRFGVEVEFTDTGPGIDPEARERIFEPFFTTKAQGTGLGLALVKRIVESHSGQLGVESPTGGGTTFRLLLPFEPEPPGLTPAPPPRVRG